jgi:2-oxoglutarate/2-oxoacid ferredoxin oxidoreductase subunit alpha
MTTVENLRNEGKPVSHLHLRYLNPFPKNLGSILKNYKKILVPELNLGQLQYILRAKYLVDAQSINKVQGKSFREDELRAAFLEALESN